MEKKNKKTKQNKKNSKNCVSAVIIGYELFLLVPSVNEKNDKR